MRACAQDGDGGGACGRMDREEPLPHQRRGCAGRARTHTACNQPATSVLLYLLLYVLLYLLLCFLLYLLLYCAAFLAHHSPLNQTQRSK